MSLQATINANAAALRARLATAVSTANRSADDVRLIAVTKTFPLTHVEAALAAGLNNLGENRIQEALQKQAAAPGRDICWHLIGHVQSNKARKAVGFDWIHSVDSVNLLRRLDQAAEEQGRTPQLLIQVDLAGEATKHGAAVVELPSILEAAATCR
ncbi:MAG: alanine racemase, partial [Acidobacteriota bacterium]|nr:alanine racemase [Acidobacteriota bacterium]